jgi:hypothetical protein
MLGETLSKQLPFAASRALNDTAFDVRKRIVGSTWPKAFKVKNTRFAGRTFKVLVRADKYNLTSVVGGEFTYPWVEAWVSRQIAGGDKRSVKGGLVAIPVNPERNAGGSIPKSQKPLNLKGSFIRNTKGGNKVIVKRDRITKETTVKYVLVPKAHIAPAFRFYQDAEDTVLRTFIGHLDFRIASAVFSGVP